MSTHQDELTAEQTAEAERIYEELRRTSDQELRRIARLLASKPDAQLFGTTEHQVRDLVHEVGAKAMQAAAAGRKKGGTRGPA
jgi:hypothetical protein